MEKQMTLLRLTQIRN